MNSGYFGKKMSKRALNAYSDGLVTRSKVNQTTLKEYEIDLPSGFIKWLMPSVIKPTEWHHTGKTFNKTYFYDLEDVRKQLEELDIDSLMKQYNGNP